MVLQLIIALLISSLLLVFKGSASSEVLFLLILLFGVPHGSLDYGIFRLKGHSNRRQFLTRYILFIVAYLAIWAINPFNALLIFIALSIFHFGQEKLEDYGIKEYSLQLILPWGCFVLFFPFLLHFDELKEYVQVITAVNLPSPGSSILSWMAAGVLCWVLFFNYRLYRNKLLDAKKSIELTIQIVVLSLLFYFLPISNSFALYFIIFHSWNAMKHQFTWMHGQIPSYSIIKYIRDLTPFTLLAYVGAFIFLWFFDGVNHVKIGPSLFIFISLLTLPHMLVFNDFYSRTSSGKVKSDLVALKI